MEPSEPPPAYSEATSSETTNQGPSRRQTQRTTSIIPTADRRSMEDESRPLPVHWERQFDPKTHHQFFVDTSANPPRSIWHHPYDDGEYLATLTPTQRQEIKDQIPQHDDVEDEADYAIHNDPSAEEHLGGVHKLGRKMKDKLTHSTHEEREAARKRRDEDEERLYRRHQHLRAQMAKAAATGEPQFLGKDQDGREVYIEPPRDVGRGFGGYDDGAYGIDPYGASIYGKPNAKYIRPPMPYARPYGYGYGGGYGLPMMGLGGGLLLGGMLF